LRRLKPDLLILHGQWAGLVGSLAGFVVGIKRMLYIAQWPAFYTDWDLYRVIRNYFTEKIPCYLVSHVVTLADSNRYQYLMRRLLPENKLSKIPNTIDLVSTPTPESGARLRQALGWRPEHCHIVSVGRLADQKRVDWLLEAWALIHHRFPEARLWIVGGGPEENSLHLLAKKLQITETCTFLGPQNNGIRFINASDIVVMTTVYEAFGNIAIESMACGKPIIANEVDGVCDTFTHGVEGYYVPPYEPKVLADYLAKLIQEPALRAKMGQAGLQSVKHYDVTSVFGRYLELIERLLKS
jgi:glycosyltransferase involved in cell wall biosynthesis